MTRGRLDFDDGGCLFWNDAAEPPGPKVEKPEVRLVKDDDEGATIEPDGTIVIGGLDDSKER